MLLDATGQVFSSFGGSQKKSGRMVKGCRGTAAASQCLCLTYVNLFLRCVHYTYFPSGKVCCFYMICNDDLKGFIKYMYLVVVFFCLSIESGTGKRHAVKRWSKSLTGRQHKLVLPCESPDKKVT